MACHCCLFKHVVHMCSFQSIDIIAVSGFRLFYICVQLITIVP